MAQSSQPHKIAVLVFVSLADGRLLLLRRAKSPNRGLWSPIGGKLETETGESPFECARRETAEEIGLQVNDEDLHLFAIIAEKAYEGQGHWLLFLFNCKVPCPSLPPPGPEGEFAAFHRSEIDRLPLPDTDRIALWPLYDQERNGFCCLRADCAKPGSPVLQVEQRIPAGRS